MSKPFDATLKGMLEANPPDWAALVGFPGRRVDIVDADVSTFTGAADKVLRVRGEPDWLLALDFQTGPDASLPRRMHVYNALLEDRHGLLVRSVAILLTRRANLTALDGRYRRQFPDEEPHLDFRYQVIRVWELQAEALLNGGLATLPLAPLADVGRNELSGVIDRMAKRFRQANRQTPDLWAASFVLMGLRYDKPLIERLLREIGMMEESVTYQAIIRKGEERGVRIGEQRALLIQGTEWFGAPAAAIRAAIESIADSARLEQLLVRIREVNSWEELLAEPAKPKARRRKK